MTPKPFRSFSRGLAVLEALNQCGSATALELARYSGVPRATVYRLLQTLQDGGYVGRGQEDDRFHLRLRVRRLAGGFEDEQWICEVAGPVIMDLTNRTSWPCDICTLDVLEMVVRDTTHYRAPLSIDRNVAGRRLPLLASSSGLAYLAFLPTAQRNVLIGLLARSDAEADGLARDPARLARLLAATRRRGYGLRQGGVLWPHTGSLALPIRHGELILGCISTIWMSRVISSKEGAQRCLGPLRDAQETIERALNEPAATSVTRSR